MYTAAGVWWRKFIRYQQRSASCQVYNVAFTVHSVAAEAAVEAAAVQATAYLVHHPSFDHHRCHIISTHNALITCLVKMFTTTEGSWYSNSNTYNHNNIMFGRRQGNHSRDNVKFLDNSMTFTWRFPALLPMLSVTHIMLVLVLLSVVGVGMQQCMIRNQNEMHKLGKVKNGHKHCKTHNFCCS